MKNADNDQHVLKKNKVTFISSGNKQFEKQRCASSPYFLKNVVKEKEKGSWFNQTVVVRNASKQSIHGSVELVDDDSV